MSLPLLEILKRHQLSVTDSRKKILELFQVTNGALAHADIEKKTGEMFDRVTIYRTLQTFVDKGIIHTIPTADNSVLYALCKDDCSQSTITTIMYILFAIIVTLHIV
jgi:Fur family ferric uptake transcriptional regulator